MPRYARIKSESGIYHIMLRGINKQTIFEEDEDKGRFLETIYRFKEISKYQLYGYCLMENHIHLLMKETDETISKSLKRISSSYVYWYNNKYGRCGHLFQERYKSEAIGNDAYLLTALRYIHQNPVKAGLGKNVNEYNWSSYNEYINNPEITDTECVLGLLSENMGKAIEKFVTYTNEYNQDKCLELNNIVRQRDDKVKEYITKLESNNSSDLQHLEKGKRDEIIKRLKLIDGVTIRQLSRITGISKSVIERI